MALLCVAGLAVLASLVGVQRTSAAWTDPTAFAVTGISSSSNWDMAVVPGADVELANVKWTVTNSYSDIQVCYSADVTTKSTTAIAWSVVINTNQAPWNGDSDSSHYKAYNQTYPITVAPGSITVSSGTTPSVSASSPQKISFCNYNLTPVPATPGTVSVTTTRGDWTSTSACVVTTVTGVASTQWYYAWQTTVDMTDAIARVKAAVGTVGAIRATNAQAMTISPALSPGTSSYTVSSQTATSVASGVSQSFTLCASQY